MLSTGLDGFYYPFAWARMIFPNGHLWQEHPTKLPTSFRKVPVATFTVFPNGPTAQ